MSTSRQKWTLYAGATSSRALADIESNVSEDHRDDFGTDEAIQVLQVQKPRIQKLSRGKMRLQEALGNISGQT